MDAWLAALTQRHAANLTSAELTRALRALSSCYVERRGKIASGAAYDGAGKRAAFATFYGPLHFLTVAGILRALGAGDRAFDTLLDLGCGSGVGGAAWALAGPARPRVTGIDRSPWAVDEANWTYAQLGVQGRAKTGDIGKATLPASERCAVLLGYAVNEMDAISRASLLTKLLEASRAGTGVLIVEAIARRDKPWWPEWTRALEAEGARENEWRLVADIPDAIRELARRAGLTLKELTARTISNL